MLKLKTLNFVEKIRQKNHIDSAISPDLKTQGSCMVELYNTNDTTKTLVVKSTRTRTKISLMKISIRHKVFPYNIKILEKNN